MEEKPKSYIRKSFIIGLVLILGIPYGIYKSLTYQTVHELSQEPPQRDEFSLKDDDLANKNPKFDAALVDSRPFEGWQVNQSAAVIKLDILSDHPSSGNDILQPSYSASLKKRVFPSVNLIDGAAKQFDDGLYAAVDLAVFRGEAGIKVSLPRFIRSIFNKLPKDSTARPFLAGALSIIGDKVILSTAENAVMGKYLAEFEEDPLRSKPAGFYTWNEELKQLWKFCRYLQKGFISDLSVPSDFAKVLSNDRKLRYDYLSLHAFYSRLTNPAVCLSADALVGGSTDLAALARSAGVHREEVSILPPSTSREVELFDKLFPQGVPEGTNLMSELVRRIMSGAVDLTPGANDGWYQWQAHALEVMLLPSKGGENEKLLLTAKYKKRILEAFMVLITKRRETHLRLLGAVRTLGASGGNDLDFPKMFYPRVRIEPAATFYLRTARAYAFIQNLLVSSVNPGAFAKLHGLRNDAYRKESIKDELETIKNRFYGFYLLSCEDIGMKPNFLHEEKVNEEICRSEALAWLRQLSTDEDLAVDTRFAVPIRSDNGETRYWLTLGVRLATLSISYAKPPKIRPADQDGGWQDIPKEVRIIEQPVLISVEDFAEVALKGKVSITREEWRALCDKYKTKDAILAALTERYGK